MSRLTPIWPKDMSDEQLDYYRATRNRHAALEGPEEVPLAGPSAAYLRCIPYGNLRGQVSHYLRHEGSLPARFAELAIIVVARHWSADLAFNDHAAAALKEGVSEAVVEAIRTGKTPDFDKADEAAIYHFIHQLVTETVVSDENYKAACDVLGEKAMIELIGLSGHYVTTAMTLKAFDIPARKGDDPLPPL
jgi:4-carboxymuconolactone decarboxylase